MARSNFHQLWDAAVPIDENVLLDEKIKAATSWDKQHIEERTKWLAEKAYKEVWKIK
jgi:hypothetical protein